MTKFIDSVEASDALGFKSHFDARMTDKVASVLDALKIEVAKKFFATGPEEVTPEGTEQVES